MRVLIVWIGILESRGQCHEDCEEDINGQYHVRWPVWRSHDYYYWVKILWNVFIFISWICTLTSIYNNKIIYTESQNNCADIGCTDPTAINDIETAIIDDGSCFYESYIGIENMNVYPDIRKARKKLKWKPKTSFGKGIKLTINYYEKSFKIYEWRTFS